jgi:hypothetical protein
MRMDPISAAIISGLVAGATRVSADALSDAYSALKTMITRRFGGDSGLTNAIEAVERAPESQARQQVLREEVASAGADQDRNILAAADALLDEIRTRPGGQQLIQQVISGSGTAAGRDVIVHPGGSIAGRDLHQTDFDLHQTIGPTEFRTNTMIGKVLMVVGTLVALGGFAFFAFNMLLLFNGEINPGRGFPPGLIMGLGVFFAGGLIVTVAKLVDQTLS